MRTISNPWTYLHISSHMHAESVIRNANICSMYMLVSDTQILLNHPSLNPRHVQWHCLALLSISKYLQTGCHNRGKAEKGMEKCSRSPLVNKSAGILHLLTQEHFLSATSLQLLSSIALINPALWAGWKWPCFDRRCWCRMSAGVGGRARAWTQIELVLLITTCCNKVFKGNYNISQVLTIRTELGFGLQQFPTLHFTLCVQNQHILHLSLWSIQNRDAVDAKPEADLLYGSPTSFQLDPLPAWLWFITVPPCPFPSCPTTVFPSGWALRLWALWSSWECFSQFPHDVVRNTSKSEKRLGLFPVILHAALWQIAEPCRG